jgi:hypothetical protein
LYFLSSSASNFIFSGILLVIDLQSLQLPLINY